MKKDKINERPKCTNCNTVMYPCGGVLKSTETGYEVPESFWRCPNCSEELTDLKEIEILN